MITRYRLSAIGVMVATSVVAQQPSAFRANTRVVPVYVTVLGPDGRLLPHLTQDQFAVFDNGKPQQIIAFSSQPVPITGVAMWDVSTSMEPYAERSRAAARAFVDALSPDDRVRFGTFGRELAFSPLMTSDKRTLHRIVDEEVWFGGNTPLWTSLERGLMLLSREVGRRVLLVFSDGGSRQDPRSKQDVLDQMQRTDCMVYAMGLEGSGISGSLKQVAEESGGGHAEFKKTADLNREFVNVLTELHHQYLIGFSPAVLDGGSHALIVRTTVAGAKVRARKTYIASAPESPR